MSYPRPRARPVRTIYPASTALRGSALRAFLPSKEAPFLRRTRGVRPPRDFSVPIFCGLLAVKEFYVREASSASVLFCRLSPSISRPSHPEIPLQAEHAFRLIYPDSPCTCSLERHGVTPLRVFSSLSEEPSTQQPANFGLVPDCERSQRAIRWCASSQHYNTLSHARSCGKKCFEKENNGGGGRCCPDNTRVHRMACLANRCGHLTIRVASVSPYQRGEESKGIGAGPDACFFPPPEITFQPFSFVTSTTMGS